MAGARVLTLTLTLPLTLTLTLTWQELVFIGMDLPEVEIRAALDRCLLDDAEMDALRTSEAVCAS